MRRKILVTGSNGLLGQKLTDLYLQKPEVEIIATGLGESRHPNSSAFIYEMMDISDLNQVKAVVAKHNPRTIIHTAALTNVDTCELDADLCQKLNVDAVRNMVVASNEVGAHLIHLSTDFIFDGENGPYKETDVANPVSIYGHSKLDAEKVVIEEAKSWAIARTILVYGIVSDMSRSNIVLWAKGALEKQNPINVVNDQFRMPTLAEDLAMGCYLIESKKAKGIFNISGKDFMNIYELVQRVGQHFGLSTECVTKIDSVSLNQPAKRPPITGFDLSKSEEILGYKPHSFEEGIEMVYQQDQERKQNQAK